MHPDHTMYTEYYPIFVFYATDHEIEWLQS